MRSKRNLVDPFTKGLTRQVILETSMGIRLKPIDGGQMVDIHMWSKEAIFTSTCTTSPSPWYMVVILRG